MAKHGTKKTVSPSCANYVYSKNVLYGLLSHLVFHLINRI